MKSLQAFVGGIKILSYHYSIIFDHIQKTDFSSFFLFNS